MIESGKIEGYPQIPMGWTYLAHGSSTGRWSVDSIGKDFTVSRELCCIEQKLLERDKKDGCEYNAPYLYSNQGEPFQIRVLFFSKDILGDKDMRPQQEVMEDVVKYYSYQGWRHPAVPRGTKLIKIAQTNYDEIYERSQNIYWYVPEKYLEMYKMALEKEKKINLGRNKTTLLSKKKSERILG